MLTRRGNKGIYLNITNTLQWCYVALEKPNYALLVSERVKRNAITNSDCHDLNRIKEIACSIKSCLIIVSVFTLSNCLYCWAITPETIRFFEVYYSEDIRLYEGVSCKISKEANKDGHVEILHENSPQNEEQQLPHFRMMYQMRKLPLDPQISTTFKNSCRLICFSSNFPKYRASTYLY